jgi:hypothetical protein
VAKVQIEVAAPAKKQASASSISKLVDQDLFVKTQSVRYRNLSIKTCSLKHNQFDIEACRSRLSRSKHRLQSVRHRSLSIKTCSIKKQASISSISKLVYQDLLDKKQVGQFDIEACRSRIVLLHFVEPILIKLCMHIPPVSPNNHIQQNTNPMFTQLQRSKPLLVQGK